MSKHLQRDLDHLRRKILEMGNLAEQAMGQAVGALVEKNLEAAERVIEGDAQLDAKELEVEEDVLKILALHQPVAADLRFLVSVLKVNNDLERIGDLAKNIAKRARQLAKAQWPEEPSRDLRRMMQRVQKMLKHALDALVRLDPQAARAVCREDDDVDLLLKDIFAALQQAMVDDPPHVPQYLATLSVARYLERSADLATNIAEDVVFMVEGEVIRHGPPEEKARILPMPRGR